VARLPLSAALPSTVAPSLKVTVPVGVPVPGAIGLTVAVKVILLPPAQRVPMIVSPSRKATVPVTTRPAASGAATARSGRPAHRRWPRRGGSSVSPPR
jgi:hypothetical protein